MAENDHRPEILDLDQLAPDLPTVKIGGKSYQMLTAEQVGLADSARSRQIARRVQKMMDDITASDEEVSAETVQELLSDADRLIAIVIPGMPTEVRNGLTDQQRNAIMHFFQQESAVESSSQATS